MERHRGDGAARFQLSTVRKDSLPKEQTMASKYTGQGYGKGASPTTKSGGSMKGKGGKRGC